MIGKERRNNVNYKIVAVDFDGTLFENKWPEIGEPHAGIIVYKTGFNQVTCYTSTW